MTEMTDRPIAENEQVKELLSLLQEHKPPGYEEFLHMVGYVTEIENRLLTAIGELDAMRKDLQTMQNHSLKTSLQGTCKSLEANIATMQQRLAELKEKIIDGCKAILADFKQHGVAALNGIAQFFHLRPAFEAIQAGAEKHQISCDRAMERVDAFVAEYHEAGKHVKNMGRALLGKDAIETAKTNGEAVKFIKAPYRASRACMGAAARAAKRAAAALERLEQSKKPSVLKAIRETKPEPPKARSAPDKSIGER